MAHFAKVLNGVVVNVIVADAEYMQSFTDTSPGEWLQTSYNTHGGVHYDPATGQPSEDQSKALRKNFAGIGYSYDAAIDGFIPPKPFPSWTLDTTTALWNPPVPMPIPVDDTEGYVWNESTLSWDKIINVPIGEVNDAGTV